MTGAALAGGLVLGLLPLATAAAATPANTPATTTGATAAAVRPATAAVAPRRADTVTLITGDHVRVGAAGDPSSVQVQPAAASGPAGAAVTQRVGGDVYVTPAVARPYVGRFLDRALFDVTRRQAAARSDGLIPVRISYTGSRPAAPGLTVTSASGGTASGYLTHTSASAFGAALTRQFTADAKLGFPARSTLFTGITRITADLPPTGGVTPRFPMYTLSVKAVGVDGKPLDSMSGILANVEDGRKYGGFVDVYDGEARVSVPAGVYTMIGDSFTYDEATDTVTDRVATVNEYTVTGAGQTLTLDFRGATVPAGKVATPRPSVQQDWNFDWLRGDAAGYGGISWSYSAAGSTDPGVYVKPSAAAKVGTLHVVQDWTTAQAGDSPAYTYDLATAYTRIPADLDTSYATGDLAVVNSRYYSEGVRRESGFLRFPVYPWQNVVGGIFAPLTTPSTRTEYVSGTGNPAWGESLIEDQNQWDDPGFWDDPEWENYPAGARTSSEWLRGPLGAGIPVQRPTGAFGSYCYGCRTSHTLSIAFAPALDQAGHVSEIFGAEDGIPVARFRFYRGTTLVSDEDDMLGGIFDVPTAATRYRAIVDVDRRLTAPRQSTRSTTEVGFTSAASQGGQLPAQNWFCDASDTGTGCRVLPVVTARLALPTDLNGRLPAGKSTVTVTVARQQNAAPGAIASAGLEVRSPGWGWETVALKPVAGKAGVFTGTIDSTDREGTDADVRITGADTAGNTFTQTVLKAYSVASAS